MAVWGDAEPASLSQCIEDSFRILRYTSVKPEQRTAIQSMLKGEDVFVSVPTGFGKIKSSLFAQGCYSRLVDLQIWSHY